MKKIARILASIVTITSLTLVPMAVQAQEDVIEVGDGTTTTSETTSLPSTGASVQAPDTGIAPSENKVVQNLAVFVGGGMLGAGLGLGIITLKKKRLE